MRAWRIALTLFLAVDLVTVATLVTAPSAHAIHPNIRRVLIFGGYGLVLGSVVGLVTVPLSQDFRTLFMGSSVGLYVGLALGVYYAATFDDPNNPFRGIPTGELSQLNLPVLHPSIRGDAPLVWLQVPVVRF